MTFISGGNSCMYVHSLHGYSFACSLSEVALINPRFSGFKFSQLKMSALISLTLCHSMG